MDHPGDDDKPTTFRRALWMPELAAVVTALAGCLRWVVTRCH